MTERFYCAIWNKNVPQNRFAHAEVSLHETSSATIVISSSSGRWIAQVVFFEKNQSWNFAVPLCMWEYVGISTVQGNVGWVCVAEDRKCYHSGVDVGVNSLGSVNATVFWHPVQHSTTVEGMFHLVLRLLCSCLLSWPIVFWQFPFLYFYMIVALC